MANAIISTCQPFYTRMIGDAVSATYPTVAPTSTKPSSRIIYDVTNLYPTLLRVMPFSTVNNATGTGMRVIGWTEGSIPKYYTNLLTYSEQFDNAAWIKASLAVTGGSINAETAPDGTTTADRVLETGATVSHYIGRDTGSPGASTDIRTFSVYAKGGLGRDFVSICAGNAAGGPYYTVTVNLNTGAVTQADLVNTGTWFTTTPTNSVTSVGNGWYRISITARQVQYYLASPNTTGTPTSGAVWGFGSYASDVAKGVILWGGQLEWGTTASPYVQTVASTVQTIDSTTAATRVWFSTVLADFTLTYSTGTVPSATVNNVSNYLFSTATQVAISPDSSMYRPSQVTATSVELASFVVDAIGHQLIELQFKGSTGTMGAMWCSI